MFELIFAVIVILYGILLFLISTGIRKRFAFSERTDTKVSIVVPVRDEAENISKLIRSIIALDYPEESVEVIFVDDESSDGTAMIVNSLTEGYDNFRLIPVQDNWEIPKGKARALDTGIRAASGEVILITDADCELPKEWIRAHLKYYRDEVNMVCGFTTVWGTDLFSSFQAYDHFYLLGIAAGMTNYGLPVSCIGNNLSFRKSAYEKTGGYSSYPCSVNEDFYLLHSIRRLKQKSVCFPLEPSSIVITGPSNGIRGFLDQKKRWGSTLKDVPIYGLLLVITAFLTNVMCLFSGFSFSSVSLYLLSLKIALDYFYLRYLSGAFSINKRFGTFLLFESIFLVYIFIVPLMLLINKKVVWKGRIS